MVTEIEKLIEELIQTLTTDFLEECAKEPEIPFTSVIVRSECIVEFPQEIPKPLKLSPVVGSIPILNPPNLNSLQPQIVEEIYVEKQTT
jgi:ABC-type antimicrobial peptide transport system ATPase subunit